MVSVFLLSLFSPLHLGLLVTLVFLGLFCISSVLFLLLLHLLLVMWFGCISDIVHGYFLVGDILIRMIYHRSVILLVGFVP